MMTMGETLSLNLTLRAGECPFSSRIGPSIVPLIPKMRLKGSSAKLVPQQLPARKGG